MNRTRFSGGFALLIAATLLTPASKAFPEFSHRQAMIGNAAIKASDSMIEMNGTLGQVAVETSDDASYSVSFGFWFVRSIDIATSVEEGTSELPGVHRLYQNRPNPFNPTTTIPLFLPVAGHVTLKIYDVSGREVATLVDEELAAGEHSIVMSPSRLGSGVYFYQLTAGAFVESKRMVLLR